MRIILSQTAACIALAVLAGSAVAADKPLSLHPDNPHYFLFHGKPTLLLTSGEHYGAVLNLDFNYIPYLDELKARKFTLTRTFAGTYREDPSAFGIVDNTLAPAPKRFLCPWARSATPGALDGGAKFDLKTYNEAYFIRLKDFVAQAGKRGVVVELSLFCAVYNDKLWDLNPMKADNNINGVGKAGRLEIYTLKDKELTDLQEALVHKIVAELKDCDNVYYEICNEPYFGGVTKEWNDRIAAAIADAEKGLPTRHLIAQNISNGSAKVGEPNPHVGVLNFHYCSPPDAVAQNYGLDRPIGFDETGFRGTADLPYRTDAWDFLVAGGAVYSNLDYSYSTAHPDGTADVTTSPGGGGTELRKQLTVLKEFMDGLDFVTMKPDNGVVRDGRITLPLAGAPAAAKGTPAASVRMLAETGKAYAVYIKGGVKAELALDLPKGKYKAEWVNTKTGAVDKAEDFDHDGGTRTLVSPAYQDDIALRVRRGAGL
jgi:Cellulase (glycosyl hydrolase family 5)